jgi:hypothetical protein
VLVVVGVGPDEQGGIRGERQGGGFVAVRVASRDVAGGQPGMPPGVLG